MDFSISCYCKSSYYFTQVTWPALKKNVPHNIIITELEGSLFSGHKDINHVLKFAFFKTVD